MPTFSLGSKTVLATCDIRLQQLFNEVIKHFDCKPIEGYRNDEKQQKAYKEGKSKSKPGQSKHNLKPSLALHIAPLNKNGEIEWHNKQIFYYFAGIVKGLSITMGIPIIWGGDWNDNHELMDQTLFDLYHFELISS